MSQKVQNVRFNKGQDPDEILAIMNEFRPDIEISGLPFFKIPPNANSGLWYVKTKCIKCKHAATQSVAHLVNYNTGCGSCRGRKASNKITIAVAKRSVEKGHVPFNRNQTPDDIVAIMKEFRPDRKILGLPFYKNDRNKKSGKWWVKTECGDCGYEATQRLNNLVNYNLGCAGCRNRKI